MPYELVVVAATASAASRPVSFWTNWIVYIFDYKMCCNIVRRQPTTLDTRKSHPMCEQHVKIHYFRNMNRTNRSNRAHISSNFSFLFITSCQLNSHFNVLLFCLCLQLLAPERVRRAINHEQNAKTFWQFNRISDAGTWHQHFVGVISQFTLSKKVHSKFWFSPRHTMYCQYLHNFFLGKIHFLFQYLWCRSESQCVWILDYVLSVATKYVWLYAVCVRFGSPISACFYVLASSLMYRRTYATVIFRFPIESNTQ